MTGGDPAAAAGHGPALLALHGAGVRFGDVVALSGVDLVLRRGERLALVGANGSGKTTLLRVLHGLQPCSEGRREVATDAAGCVPRQAMLFQRPFLLSLSAASNIRLALWLQGVPGPQRVRRCDEALERVGLLDQARRPARTLSGGQQQRLALARAWALRPELLFLDEPTANLDPGAKRDVEALVARWADEGLTVVISSHNLGQVKRLATRVLYLEGGRVLVDAPTQEFFRPGARHGAAAFLQGEMITA
jgi:tungstate transport system ATP-binding protein